jgi:hypothetical protein
MPPPTPHRRATVGTIIWVAVATCLLDSSSAKANTKAFRQVTAKDFEEGEATGTSVLAAGEIVPGLVATRTPVDAAFVWCGVASRDGETAYFGTGDQGRIFSVPLRGGPGAKTGARWLATLDAPWVTALAVRKDGTLLAGTTPGGRVFTVNAKSGEARVLGQVGAGHVWALVRDDQAALTYVGSGSPGKIFVIDDAGKVRPVWDSGDKHVVSLMKDSDGTLLAGTSENAILYRVHRDGRAEAVQDFEAEEVRAIVRAPGGLFVAANDFDKMSIAPTQPGPVAAKGTRIVLGTGGPPSSAGSLPRPGARKSKAAVYRIEDDGHIEQVFALADGYLTALAVADDGSVFAAAGTQGHVFRVTPDRVASLVIDLPERQALTLVRSGARLLVGTGDVGGIYSAEPPAATGGLYLSKVLDAEFPARWGTLRWMGTHITFETRSGNTAKPDGGWAPWKVLDRNQSEPPGGAGAVASPGARYLQYRASFPTAASRLRGVTTSYLPQNQRARITEVTLADAAGAAPVIAGTTTAAVRPGHSAVLKLRWKIDNPDGDELVYRTWFRQANESIWRPMTSAAADPLTKPEYDWNTEGIPDGLYIVRVTASDERAQPRDRALLSSLDSTPLLVDNGKPDVVDLAVNYPSVAGRARDDASAISQIEFSVDGGEFRLVSPADGIADDPIESFSFRLPALAPGPHSLAIRATDSADNIGAAQITLKAP